MTTTSVGTIFVQGRSLGSTTLTAQAAGYNDDTSNVTVNPSGFILNAGNFSTNTFAANTALRVDAALLTPAHAELPAVAGAAGRAVDGERPGDELRYQRRHDRRQSRGVQRRRRVRISPRRSIRRRLAPRTISLTTPAGFQTPNNLQSITATVTAPSISVSNATIGRDLQEGVSIGLGATPPSPVTVTVTSNNGTIATITKDGTVAGGTSLTFENVTTTSVGTIFVQGRGLGSTTLTVQAAGYNDATSNVTVNPSGFVLITGNFSTNTFAANSTLRVDAAMLTPGR